MADPTSHHRSGPHVPKETKVSKGARHRGTERERERQRCRGCERQIHKRYLGRQNCEEETQMTDSSRKTIVRREKEIKGN